MISGTARLQVAAHLDGRELTLRGAQRTVLPLTEINFVEVRPGGVLELRTKSATLCLAMPDRSLAEKWRLKIRYPKGRLDKLGVKPESRVAVIGVTVDSFHRELSERLSGELLPPRSSQLEIVFYAADSERELSRLSALRKQLVPAGAIWVVSLKGKAAKIKDTDVMRAAKQAGLVDIKVCGFSETHTALKLVIPVADRK